MVAGMSGSPVYLEGKLAGALSLKLGVFTKEPIGGVTPIHDVMDPLAKAGAKSPQQQRLRNGAGQDATMQNFSLPPQMAKNGLPSGSALEPIETPLVFSGFPAASCGLLPRRYRVSDSWPRKAVHRAARDDGQLVAGDMAGMVLVQGDASINSACTVTAVRGDQRFSLRPPFLSLGKCNCQWPVLAW